MAAEPHASLERVLRHERGRILGGLVRVTGSLDAAEDALQDAAMEALRVWPSSMPANAGAWLTTVARNRARDALRHRATAEAAAPLLHETASASLDDEDLDQISDDQLRLLFTCCHPVLPRDSQVALTLKVVIGLTTAEIARAFVTSEDTISQRILRAKRGLEDSGLGYRVPAANELDGRVDAVLGVIYAMLNEGHQAHRVDLQKEALELARLVCDLVPGHGAAFGLAALAAFAVARAHSRLDEHDLPVLLAEQDRSAWSRELLREGLIALQRARQLGRGSLVLQAEIAAMHVTADTYAETNWTAIVALYDALLAIDSSPIVALNCAVALAMRDGPAAGLAALAPLERDLAPYPLFEAVRSSLRAELDRTSR